MSEVLVDIQHQEAHIPVSLPLLLVLALMPDDLLCSPLTEGCRDYDAPGKGKARLVADQFQKPIRFDYHDTAQ